MEHHQPIVNIYVVDIKGTSIKKGKKEYIKCGREMKFNFCKKSSELLKELDINRLILSLTDETLFIKRAPFDVSTNVCEIKNQNKLVFNCKNYNINENFVGQYIMDVIDSDNIELIKI